MQQSHAVLVAKLGLSLIASFLTLMIWDRILPGELFFGINICIH